jgi:hypothetical protein
VKTLCKKLIKIDFLLSQAKFTKMSIVAEPSEQNNLPKNTCQKSWLWSILCIFERSGDLSAQGSFKLAPPA